MNLIDSHRRIDEALAQLEVWARGWANLAQGGPLTTVWICDSYFPKTPTLLHKNRKYLSDDVMSFSWLNDFNVDFHVFM